jgi:hypothetical protein
VTEQLPLPCVHHYVIAEPAGPTSRGECKRCGAVREVDRRMRRHHFEFLYDRQPVRVTWPDHFGGRVLCSRCGLRWSSRLHHALRGRAR